MDNTQTARTYLVLGSLPKGQTSREVTGKPAATRIYAALARSAAREIVVASPRADETGRQVVDIARWTRREDGYSRKVTTRKPRKGQDWRGVVKMQFAH